MKGDNVLSPHNKRDVQKYDESKVETQKDKIIDYCGNYVSGILVVFASEPLDTIKVRMQTFPTMYKGMADCFRKTIKRDTKTGLFAGTTPAMVAGLLDNTISMIGYETFRVILLTLSGKKLTEELSLSQRAAAGCLTAGVSCLYLCPMDLLKCQLQAWRDIRDMHSRAGLQIQDIKPWKLMN
ncbi:mitochondrial ornithine transporter 2-like [Ctenocephalides felis]|uniref:mitochondrial ornithine transporter 2-like n=1 Tax=Ctenocephalides felis TaxID=7515 RepID=UPI000E6E2398|nr:mitochondrial ornithine transporter 2-like [Ctenocephalides felis]